MLLDETIEFLKNAPPFQFLDEKALADVAGDISMEYYPKGSTVLYQDGPPSRHLWLIKKGGVKVFMKSSGGEEVVIDFRSEGESFGFLSLVGGDKSRANVVAVEDTICFLIAKKTVLGVMDGNPSFTEYFVKSFLDKFIDRTYEEMHAKSMLTGGGDKLLFTTPVGSLVKKGLVAAGDDISIKEAAATMSRHGISSLVVVDRYGVPAGIVTDRDLREKVVARARNTSEPVSAIMSVSLIKAEARDYCFEALLKMIKYNIHHLLVVESGRLKGIITNHDLMMLQGTSPISVVREIEGQYSVEGLAAVSKGINRIVGLLLKEGARAGNITKIITEVNDRLVRKVLELAEKTYGPPPLTYCWIALGSEGRKEQTFKADQDNALIYSDPSTDEESLAAKKYFAEFVSFVTDGLSACGFPACPAGCMASNPRWRQPLKAWKRVLLQWVSEPTQEAVMSSLIFFDFRPVYGDAGLAESLRDYLASIARDERAFLGTMANAAIKNRPPIGFFKTLVVEKGGEHKDELNLKVKGSAPIVDMVRLFALEKGVKETSTLERIDALKQSHSIVGEYAEEMEHAFEFLMHLRIQHQFEHAESGSAPDNFINPDRLSGLQRRALKDAFGFVNKMQDLIIERYKEMIW